MIGNKKEFLNILDSKVSIIINMLSINIKFMNIQDNILKASIDSVMEQQIVDISNMINSKVIDIDDFKSIYDTYSEKFSNLLNEEAIEDDDTFSAFFDLLLDYIKETKSNLVEDIKNTCININNDEDNQLIEYKLEE